MITKRLLPLLAILSLISTTVHPVEKASETKPTVIILWDIHDVLLKRDKKQIFETFWHYKHKWNLIKHCSPRLFLNAFNLLRKKIFSKIDNALTDFIETSKQHNPFLIDLTLKICNAYKPIEGTIAIIDELRDLGYEQHIGSNINPYAFENLLDRETQPVLSTIFTQFDESKSQFPFMNAEGRYIEKPQAKFFLSYLEKNKIDLENTHVIFIDDRTENVEAANNCGLTGILFKSPTQLRHELIECAILPQKSAKTAHSII